MSKSQREKSMGISERGDLQSNSKQLNNKPQKTVSQPQINNLQEVRLLNENNFMRVEDVAKELGISISHSYKIMQQLNKELKAKGYMTIAGRVNRKYFMEKFCYSRTERK